MHHLNHNHKPTQRYQANHIVWLRCNAIEVLFAVKAFELELLQPWDEKAFVTFKWPCFFYYLFVCFIFGQAGSLLLTLGSLQLQRVEVAHHCGARASHRGGSSWSGARAPTAPASVAAARSLWGCISDVRK